MEIFGWLPPKYITAQLPSGERKLSITVLKYVHLIAYSLLGNLLERLIVFGVASFDTTHRVAFSMSKDQSICVGF